MKNTSKLKEVSSEVYALLRAKQTTGIFILIDEHAALTNSLFVSELENDGIKSIQEMTFAYAALCKNQKKIEGYLLSRKEVNQNEMIEVLGEIKKGNNVVTTRLLNKL